MAAVLFDKGAKFGDAVVEAKAVSAEPDRRPRRSGGGLAEAMSGLFGN